MKKLFVAALLALLVGVVFAGELRLRWNPVVGANGYQVYVGDASRTYNTPQDVGTATDAVVSVPDAQMSYAAVTAYNSAGESGYSEEVMGWPRPTVAAFDASCAPRVEGGVECTGVVTGTNLAPDVSVEIPYTGVTITGTNRLTPTQVEVVFTVEQSALGGEADLVVTNPWQRSDGGGGQHGPTMVGMVTITPVVLPSAPGNVVLT